MPRRCWCPSMWCRWCCTWPRKTPRRSPASCSMSSSGTLSTAWVGGSAGKCWSSEATIDGVSFLTQESKGRRAESPKIRKDRGEVGVPDAEPGSEGGAVLVDCHRRYPAPSCPASLIGIVWASRGQRGENGAIGARNAVEVPAAHGPAHDDMVRAPGMIRAQVPVGHEGAGEVGEGERHDL